MTTAGTVPLETSAGTDGWRPAAHFAARDTWLNDPNGLLFHDGVYHLYFQNNPHGSTWGNISWGHATSTDLVTWHEQPVAIEHTDEEMVFSGSAVVDHRNTAGFAGPGETALVAVYTSASHTPEGRPRQAQSLAYSLDGGYEWTRYTENPVLDIGSGEFRDPKVFWYGGDDGHWVMVVVEAADRRVAVYTSPDLRSWTRTSEFGPAHATGGVWECPDLFELPVEGTADSRWVMIVSLNPGAIAGGSGTQYFIGDFDGERFTPERLSASEDLADFDWFDFGRDCYAAVSFSNVPDGRRLMVGWASNWEYAEVTPTGPWRSAMTLVREISLARDPDGRHRLRQTPILPTDAPRLVLAEDTLERTADEASGLLVFSTTVADDGSATFVLDSGPEAAPGTGLRLTVDAAGGHVVCDRTRTGGPDVHPAYPSVDEAPLPTRPSHDDVAVEVLVDGSVVEISVDGGLVTFTELVFPERPYRRLTRQN
ncbi:glycoside hydrolase family 32 protein [Nesterenkonia sp. PF2B19]|uniref:glycoside hydrolase family 32 protein n=1 Tax=Nesterenkonia sp. PF2B19 TaxID=1881858 RepID=UPI0008734355|nr:glycoside hydrolase family 32 protein [Nesterenkonia sp. PF2B19]OSM42717.1 glycosyl hydrolase family 32 [Nesterenkonia sp. PF2B19]